MTLVSLLAPAPAGAASAGEARGRGARETGTLFGAALTAAVHTFGETAAGPGARADGVDADAAGTAVVEDTDASAKSVGQDADEASLPQHPLMTITSPTETAARSEQSVDVAAPEGPVPDEATSEAVADAAVSTELTEPADGSISDRADAPSTSTSPLPVRSESPESEAQGAGPVASGADAAALGPASLRGAQATTPVRGPEVATPLPPSSETALSIAGVASGATAESTASTTGTIAASAARAAPTEPTERGPVVQVNATAATAPTTAALAPEPVDPPAAPVPRTIAAQVAPAVVSIVQRPAGTHQLTMTIDPESLGPVTVRAHIGAGGDVRVELLGATDAGRDALRSIVADLRRDLATVIPQASLSLGAGTATDPGASDRGPQAGPGNGSGDSGSGARDGGRQAPARTPGADLDPTAARSLASTHPVALGAGLDIFA